MATGNISSVLREFRIGSAEDYGRLRPGDRTHFVRRLFKAADIELQTAAREIPHLGGLKLHYETSEYSGYLANAPSPTFLKRLLFYSNRSLISFPFQVFQHPRVLRGRRRWDSERMYFGDILSLGRRAHGGSLGEVRKSYWIDRAAFDAFVNLCCRTAQMLDTGYVNLVPIFPDSERNLRRGSLGLTSANFRLRALQTQFEERVNLPSAPRRSALGITNLLLPHFSRVPIDRLVEIREREANRYLAFQRKLESLLSDAETTTSEERLLQFLREVDGGVRELDAHFRQIQKDYRRRNITLGIKLLMAGLVMYAPVEAKEVIGTIVGGMSGLEFLSSVETCAQEKSRAQESDFYLPWLIFKV